MCIFEQSFNHHTTRLFFTDASVYGKRRKERKKQKSLLSGSSGSSSSTISASEMKNIIEKLKSQRCRDSTRQTYYRIWKLFNKFLIRLDNMPKEWEERLVLFIGFLIENELQSSTVKTYLSAIKGVLVENNIRIQEDRFLLMSLTRACKIKNDICTVRLPIRKNLFNAIIKKIEQYFGSEEVNQPYLQRLYMAVFTATYYGLLCIGEVTQSPHAVLAKDVFIRVNKNKMLFLLRSSKTHGQGAKPQLVKIAQQTPKKVGRNKWENKDPFEILNNYLLVRPDALNKNEQFFVFADNSPLKPEHMRSILTKMILLLNLNPRLYCVHGMRADA